MDGDSVGPLLGPALVNRHGGRMGKDVSALRPLLGGASVCAVSRHNRMRENRTARLVRKTPGGSSLARSSDAEGTHKVLNHLVLPLGISSHGREYTLLYESHSIFSAP